MTRRRLAMVLAATLAGWLLPALPAGAVGVYPVDGPVVRGFDPPPRPWLAGHRGVDLRASPGTPVRAAAAGRVGFVGLVAGKPVVTVWHGPLRTTYEPVVGSARPGQLVAAGQVIGTLESGHSCPPPGCLHWGLRRGEEYLDPLWLVGIPRVRLLPARTAVRLGGATAVPRRAPPAAAAAAALAGPVRQRRSSAAAPAGRRRSPPTTPS